MTPGPNAAWLEQFATRLIETEPATTPLDAVRHAVDVFPRVSDLDPDVAADIYAAAERSGDADAMSVAVDRAHAAWRSPR